jgi:hypothetical protein
MNLLTTTAEVATLCAELATELYVAVDTEFMRDRTYWPKLCLVQLAGAQRHAPNRPLAWIASWSKARAGTGTMDDGRARKGHRSRSGVKPARDAGAERGPKAVCPACGPKFL